MLNLLEAQAVRKHVAQDIHRVLQGVARKISERKIANCNAADGLVDHQRLVKGLKLRGLSSQTRLSESHGAIHLFFEQVAADGKDISLLSTCHEFDALTSW